LTELLNEPFSAATDDERSDVWDLLATAYINVGDYAKAEPFVRRVLAYTRRINPAHPDLATELVNLGLIQHHQRDYQGAEQSFREALAIDEAWYPKHHPDTAGVRRILANTLFEEALFDQAQVLAHEALEDEERAYGNMHVEVAYALQTLAGWPGEANVLLR
jgi:serine/threonine-protein kinase